MLPDTHRPKARSSAGTRPLKNRILLENYFFSEDLEAQIAAFVDHYNHRRYHESISNLTPADVYFGRHHPVTKRKDHLYVEPAARRLGVASSLAVLCARNLSARWRMAIYAAAAFVVTMIALSRMYLQAHWPSDVLAGLLFGTGVVSVFAFVIHDRPIAGSVGKMAAILGLVLAIVYPFHVRSSFDTAKIKYANQLQIQAMTTRIG